jgi:hypothetical protein
MANMAFNGGSCPARSWVMSCCRQPPQRLLDERPDDGRIWRGGARSFSQLSAGEMPASRGDAHGERGSDSELALNADLSSVQLDKVANERKPDP